MLFNLIVVDLFFFKLCIEVRDGLCLETSILFVNTYLESTAVIHVEGFKDGLLLFTFG